MCSERDLGRSLREGPVDRAGVCHCSMPESVQVVLRKIQILSFDNSAGVGFPSDDIGTVPPPFRRDAVGGLETLVPRLHVEESAFEKDKHRLIETSNRRLIS
jgi:hypothetical protein